MPVDPSATAVEGMDTPDGVYTGTVRGHPRGPELGVVKHGRGRMVRPDGDVYEGEFEFDSMCGSGVLTAADGGEYEGEFWGNLRHGIGVENFPDGSTYGGQWKHGCKHGKGDEQLPDGELYEGLFFEGRRQGFGKLTLPNGVVLRGEFSAGLPHGRCTVEYCNGDLYEGHFIEGRRSGRGHFYVARSGAKHHERFNEEGRCVAGSLAVPCVVNLESADGSVYEGEFRRGEGCGDSAEDLSEVHWSHPLPGARDGTAHGKGVLRRSGRVYKGEFADDVPEGQGVLDYPSDAEADADGRRPVRFEGSFHNGLPTGWGTLLLSNGDKREGTWQQEKAEGLQFHCREGDKLEGAWHSAMWHCGNVCVENRYPRAQVP
eukprot:TRINITY_DN26210_c0_g1_i1.p1 TRINITY_DN26210_c0_g1~~TRINITY_DN26210_c0_g1_i1.p1  ORF type:complete len:373 (+),score=132.54 TRINITY_DN26210_c0_g1_i1:49-1167(+)